MFEVELKKQKVADFFEYARKRYQIMLDKDADWPKPWTSDPILQSYRFCNVFREDDKVTKWFRENIRQPMFNDPEVLFATMLFRWFNRIETGERLIDFGDHQSLQLFSSWDIEEVRRRLTGVSPVVTAAYIVRTPFGFTKLEGILDSMNNIYDKVVQLQNEMNERQFSLQEAHSIIASWPFMGDFTAYEVVTDLRYTRLLQDAPDIMTWANPGPGAARGLDRLCGVPLGTLKRGSSKDREIMFGLMRQLLKGSQNPDLWPQRWPKWEMREVEHTLCEVDKYERAKAGEGRPKQQYQGK